MALVRALSSDASLVVRYKESVRPSIMASESESVKCRFSKCRFSAELEKLEKYSRWGAASKNKSKKPCAMIFTLSPCGNRCRFSESAICSLRVHPPSKIE